MNRDDPADRFITAAIGFCELDMWQDAWDELEKLEPGDRARPEVLRIRLGIFMALKRFESAAILATSLISSGFATPTTWLQGALAIRRHWTLSDAKAFLLRAEDSLAGHALYHYTLACFECQLGDLDAAKARLTLAIQLDPQLKATALNDTDLDPIW